MGNNPDSHTPSTSDRSGNVSPFGEDVSQLIRTLWFPWTLNSRMGQGQVGLFNTVINEQQTGNAEQERNIVTEVASYGKQLGRINDALSVLISLVVLQRDPSKLHADERQALQDFSMLFREIAEKKGEHVAPTETDLDLFLSEIQSLAIQDPPTYERMLMKLREFSKGDQPE